MSSLREDFYHTDKYSLWTVRYPLNQPGTIAHKNCLWETQRKSGRYPRSSARISRINCDTPAILIASPVKAELARHPALEIHVWWHTRVSLSRRKAWPNRSILSFAARSVAPPTSHTTQKIIHGFRKALQRRPRPAGRGLISRRGQSYQRERRKVHGSRLRSDGLGSFYLRFEVVRIDQMLIIDVE